MVASRHPSSRPAGARSLERRIVVRQVSSRSPSASPAGGCRGQRPLLRLVVDNTICRSGDEPVPVTVGSMHRVGISAVAGAEPGSVAVEFGAWLKASARLVAARWRLARQRLVNSYGPLGLSGRLGGLAPVVGLIAVVVFGGLFGLRAAQESSSSQLDGLVGGQGSVAAVATSTSDAAGVARSATPSAPGSSIVVHPGDSLWSIAVSRYPERDPRWVVDAFVEVNGRSMIRSGQLLIVPPPLLEE